MHRKGEIDSYRDINVDLRIRVCDRDGAFESNVNGKVYSLICI